MQRSFPPLAKDKPMNDTACQSEINERLSLALKSSRQVAFDWHINDDCLYFSGQLNDGLKGLLLDTSKTWRSSAIPGILHDNDKANFRTRLHEALKGGANSNDSYCQCEVRLKDALRAWRWVNISGKIVERDREGRALRMVGTFSDIDERKRAERRDEQLRNLYAALSQIHQAIVRIPDLDLLLREVCRISVEQGPFDLAWVGLADNADTEEPSQIAAYGHGPVNLRNINDYLCTAPATSDVGNPAAVPGNRLGINLERVSPHGFQSFASFPLELHGEPYGTLNFHAFEDGFFDTPVSELLEGLARDMSFAIEKRERESLLAARNASAQLGGTIRSAIIAEALDCIVTLDQDGRILSFNTSAERTFRFNSEDVLGKRLLDVIIAPPRREHYREKIASALRTGEGEMSNRRVELDATRADGSALPVELVVVPINVQEKLVFTAFIRDISEIKRSQSILHESAMRYRQLVELSPEATLVYQENRIVLINQAACRLLGTTRAEALLGRSILDFVHEEHHPFLSVQRTALSRDLSSHTFVEQVWQTITGQHFNAEVGATSLIHNGMPSVQLVVRDITARKRAEALQLGQNRILNMVATGAPLPAILTEIARFAEAQSTNGLSSILQLRRDGMALSECVAPSLPQDALSRLGEENVSARNGSCGAAAFHGEPVIVADISTSPLWEAKREVALEHGLKACSAWPIAGKNRKVLGVFALYYRETVRPSEFETELLSVCASLAGIAIESRASEERIRYLAHYDGLTSLPNRFLFKEYLDLALRNAQRHHKKFAVLFLDLDKFKEINDTLGHDAGDLVLREIARRLRGSLRHNDKIARMGGDEFYVLIEDLNNGGDAAEVAQKLLDEAKRPIQIGDNEYRLSVSIGIAIYPNDGGDGHTLLKNADKAMYRAKELGKNAFQFYSLRDTSADTNLALIRPALRSEKKQIRLA